VAVAGAWGILGFDGKKAIISTIKGLSFLDVEGTPQPIGQLATDQLPTSLVRSGDHLVVGSNTAVTVVLPPCPP
jgi:hypothetical protein